MTSQAVQLTRVMARNAIYLDFEGRKSIGEDKLPLPHMAGLFRPASKGTKGKYEAIFFWEAWKPAANGSKGRATLRPFSESFEELIVELDRDDKYLIYWTIHEQSIVEKHLTSSSFTNIAPRMINLHPIARKYARIQNKFGKGQSARGKTLEDFFAALYRKRKPYPALSIGPSATCQRIDAACNRTQKWRKFTDKQKTYVNDLLAYNEGDCRATWLIAKKTSNFYEHK